MNKSPKWKTISSKQGADLKIFQVRHDKILNPRNGKTIEATVLEAADAANVVAITPENKILMVQQYRFGTQKFTIEIPGGLVESGEPNLAAVQRELQEETGYTSTDWSFLGTVESNPVFMNSYVHHWLAKDVKRTDIPQLDDGEDIQILELTIEEIKEYIKAGKIAHPHTISALVRVFVAANLFA